MLTRQIDDSVTGKEDLWEPLLCEWDKVLEQYARLAVGDSALEYLERPNVGFLAAAAWRLGSQSCALEEYGDRSAKKSRGRHDLWIRVGKHDVDVEAKVSDRKRLEVHLEEASRDLKRHWRGRKKERPKQGVAACFTSIYVERSSPIEELKDLQGITDGFFERFSGSRRIIAVSCLPKKILRSLRERWRTKHVPGGMAFVGQSVWQEQDVTGK